MGAGATGWAAAPPGQTVGTAARGVSSSAQWARSPVTSRTFPKQVTRYGGGGAPSDLRRSLASPQVAAGPVTAQINVTYTGFPIQARAAFQAAVDIWEHTISSPTPIDVTADWSDLTSSIGDGVLGAAGPEEFVRDFPNAPRSGVYYPIALANALAGFDLIPANYCTSAGSDPSEPDISASFNSRPPAPWYLGTDGRTPRGYVDLESVVLHELGHGLGFLGTFDGLNPTTGADQGRGYFGLSGDGSDETIFDSFAGTANGTALDTFANASTSLGSQLRSATGVRWIGTNGVAANGGTRPLLYAPTGWSAGSSFSHLDQTTYQNTANALMTPAIPAGIAHHAIGPIVLGIFADMGWPRSSPPPAVGLGSYHPARINPLARLAARTGVTRQTVLTIPVTGRFGVPADPSSVRAVAVNVEVKNPTAAGYAGALPGCAVGSGKPDTQDYRAGQSRESYAVLPVDRSGSIRVSLSNGAAEVNVDLQGWYAQGGTYYHHLQDQKVAVRTNVSAARPVDVFVLGRAGIPTSGVTAVVFKARGSGTAGRAFLALGPGGITSHNPTLAIGRGEMLSNLTTVPLGTGAAAGKVRIRLTAGTGLVSLEAVGWYGASRAYGQVFPPGGPGPLSEVASGQRTARPGPRRKLAGRAGRALVQPDGAWLGRLRAGWPPDAARHPGVRG